MLNIVNANKFLVGMYLIFRIVKLNLRNKHIEIMDDSGIDRTKSKAKPSRRIIIATLVSVLPLLGWPPLISRLDPDNSSALTTAITVAFPLYAIILSYTAYKLHASQPIPAWILLVVLWLSYGAAIYYSINL